MLVNRTAHAKLRPHRGPIAWLAHFFAGCFLAASSASPAAAEERPDIVVFLTDDLSQLDTSPYGGRGIRTPHMQRLAEAGLTFDRAYVASPSCAPSRAALLTGLMPARNGAEANHSRPRPELKKWPAWFQEIGYEVVAFGKVSHYRHTAEYGFDHFAHDTFHDHAAIPAAVEFLKHRVPTSAKPLCLMVGSNWPHVPWPETDLGYDTADQSLPPGSIDTPETREWRARYAAAVTKADDDLGLVYDAALECLGPATLFVFTSDHGAQWPFAKWTCYEAGVRVPLVIAWPGVVKPGTHTAALVSWVDLLPTLLEAAAGTPPDGIDGRSFLAVLRGDRAAHREMIFTTHSGDGNWNVYPARSVCNERWKYILNLHPEFAFTTHIDLPGNLGQRAYFSTWEAAAERDPAAAEIVNRYHARPAEELYDLTVDPHEQRNLAGDPRHADVLRSLRTELQQWMRNQGDRQTVFGEPRLLSDPASYGPDAPPGNVPRRNR
jgi:arylsulfatase A-like enzyme